MGDTQRRISHFGQRASPAASRRSSNPHPFRRQMYRYPVTTPARLSALRR